MLLAAAAAPLTGLACTAAARAETASTWRRFEVATEINLPPSKDAALLWAPMIQTLGDYQSNPTFEVQGSGAARRVRDGRYRASLLTAAWPAADTGDRTLRLVQTVATRNRTLTKTDLSLTERRLWLASDYSLPTDGIVRDTARRIVALKIGPRAQARAIYDWVVDNTFRDPETRGCGLGDVKSLLESGRLGGKCADINSLMVALCRSVGLPARDVYGVRVAPSAFHKCLGASGDITHAQHCRAEIYLEGEGWLPVDPADVRKVVLEEKLPVDSPIVKAERERLFGSWEMNWVGFNSATDIAPPDAPRKIEANFLMYPYAMVGAKDLDWLEPSTFQYRMTSREIA
jgi:transglutaminase-like putative cysteine protease